LDKKTDDLTIPIWSQNRRR